MDNYYDGLDTEPESGAGDDHEAEEGDENEHDTQEVAEEWLI